MTRQVGIIVGAGTLLVIALFLVTAVSKNRETPPVASVGTTATMPPSAVQAGDLPPLSPQIAEQVEALEGRIEQQEGEARVASQRELVDLLFGAGRLDRAAIVQQAIAEVTGDVRDWQRTGDLYYDWMSSLDGQDKVDAAQHAIDAYQRVLTVEPDNLDVRTDLATAYLSSNSPMQGVQEIRRVLDTDSTHIQARFNYGIMLAMIGRGDQAVEQFQYVRSQVGPDSPLYQQAADAIASVQSGGGL